MITAALLFTPSHNSDFALAGTCASNCRPHPLQFKPGQYLRVEVMNYTPRLLRLEKMPEMKRIYLNPGEVYRVDLRNATDPNFALLFWDETGRALGANVYKYNFGTLRLELRPSEKFPGYRSLHLLTDGKVRVF